MKCLCNECTQRKKNPNVTLDKHGYKCLLFPLFRQNTISNSDSQTSTYVCETWETKKTEFKPGTSMILDRLKLKFLQSTLQYSSLKFSFILGGTCLTQSVFFLPETCYLFADYFAKVIIPVIKLQSTICYNRKVLYVHFMLRLTLYFLGLEV